MELQKFTAWEIDGIQVRNYGGNGYNVYIDGTEIDYFTYYGNDPDETIKEYIKETLFDELF